MKKRCEKADGRQESFSSLSSFSPIYHQLSQAFNFVEGAATIPNAIGWIFSNLMVTQESIDKLPKS